MVPQHIGLQISIVEDFLLRCNKGKGPGAVVLGQVVSTATLLSYALKAGGVLGTAVPLLVAYQNSRAEGTQGSQSSDS